MHLLENAISMYSEGLTSSESPLLAELNRYTHAKVLQPRMLSGHLQGRLLALLSQLLRPRKILEIGCYTGYSALCLAEGLHPEGSLISLDVNEELESLVHSFWQRSPYAHQMELRIGRAQELIPALGGPFDLVFIDADKQGYPQYYDLVIDKVASGGLIIADNVLRAGDVLNPEKIAKEKDVQALMAYTQKVHEDPRVENLLLPIRDGLMLARKK